MVCILGAWEALLRVEQNKRTQHSAEEKEDPDPAREAVVRMTCGPRGAGERSIHI